MILKENLRNIVRVQKTELLISERDIRRDKIDEININVPFAIIISGVRRCGKSTLLRQIISNMKNFYYFNFEDPKADGFSLEDFQKLDDVFQEEYSASNFYFFDEVQNVQKWELFVRYLLDKGKHFIITGSNASLLSKELGTKLTGRHLRYELFPFSFSEFLKLLREKPSIKSFEDYFTRGGFPEYIRVGKSEILQELFNDILIRDIAIRYKIRNVKTLREMALYLITNIGKEFSYNSLKKIFKLGSVNSVISFVSYLEDSYMIFTVPKFDYSLKKQIINPKKVYSIDNGFSNVNSASFSEDKGRMLENMVYLALRRKFNNIFYLKEDRECDFVIKESTKITEAIQVCYELMDDNKEREIDGLITALKKFNLNSGLILTYNQEDEIVFEGKKIIIMPVWRWLFSQH